MNKLNCNVFLAVVETGSFKRAADILGYTQAGISYIINSLEDELGLKLFYREHGGVRLTSDGENLLPLIRQVDLAERNLKDRVNNLKGLNAGKVRVSTFNAVSIHWLPGIMRTFKEKYPAIELEIISREDNQENEQLIFCREVDCGFLPEVPSAEIEFFGLLRDSYMCNPAIHSACPGLGG